MWRASLSLEALKLVKGYEAGDGPVQDSDVLTEALKEFAEEFPQLMRPLIEERDEYMVFLLRTLATRCGLPLPCMPVTGFLLTS